MKKLTIFTLLFLLSSSLYSKEFKSGTDQVLLVELFTSESCSSCPSAEAWLNKLNDKKILWKKVVPVEFHVDYWNHLDWFDDYSKPQYTQRQYKYNQKIKKGVFTPQIIVRGKNYKAWRGGRIPKTSGTASALNVNFKSKLATMEYMEPKTGLDLICNAAFLGGGYVTKVKSGENKGKTLPHDFIVLNHKKSVMKYDKKKKSYSCKVKIGTKSKLNPKQKSMAFWVQDVKTFKVYQATGAKI